jgi:hypothetical protein
MTVVQDVNSEEKIYVPTNIYGAFRYVINKEKIFHLLEQLKYKQV